MIKDIREATSDKKFHNLADLIKTEIKIKKSHVQMKNEAQLQQLYPPRVPSTIQPITHLADAKK